jgi:hypothetical protein
MIKLLLKSNEESREMEFADVSISIGRSSDNLIPLADKKASRKHAVIEKVGQEYRINDHGSGNGTRVNGQEVTQQVLAKGDEIRIGLSSLYVLEVDTPARPAAAPPPATALPPAPPAAAAPIRAAEPSPAPAPAEEEPAPAEAPSPEAAEARRRNTRRAYGIKRSSSGGFFGAVAALLIMGALGYAGWHYYQKELQREAAAPAPAKREKRAPASKEADDAYAALESKVKASEPVTDALLAEASDLCQKFGSQNPSFEFLVLQLKQKKSEQAGKATLAEVEVQVTSALRDHKYGEAMDALRPLKNAYESPSTAALVNKIFAEARTDFKSVEDYGKKLVDQKNYSLAIDHYRSQAPRFKGTEYFKYLSDKPERLDEMAKADQALALAREKSPAPAAPAAPPAEPKPEPEVAKATPKPPAPEPPKEMPKEEAKKETPKPPEPKEMAKEMPKPKPEPKEPPKPAPKEPPAMPKEEKKEDPGAAKTSGGAFKKPDKLCDCKKIVKGVYCIKCDRVLEPDDLRKGVCKRCEEKPKKVDMCIKKYYEADGKPETISDKPVTSEGKVYDIPHESRARIVYFCDSCEEVGDIESDVKHKPDCKNKFNLTKVCLKSGTPPHVSK